MADQLAQLEADPAALEAWQLFHQSVSRFTVDAHLSGSVLLKLIGDRDPEDFADVIERLTLLYDVLCPVPERKDS